MTTEQEHDEALTPWLTIAKKERGVKEVVGMNDNPRIIEYHSVTTLRGTEDEIPWCSSFVCWCLQQAGYKHTKSAAAKSYLDYGLPCDMAIGSIAVLTRKGGNQSDQVKTQQYPLSRVQATRWPVKA